MGGGKSIVLAALAAPLFVSGLARGAGPTKRGCIDANAEAQRAARSGHLLRSREQLAICVVDACPQSVRRDCATRLAELEPRIPTVILGARDAAGRDLAAVEVTLDGEPLAARLDGLALPVDPGDHTFVFRADGLPPVTEKVVVGEGEKGRRIQVRLAAPEPPPAIAPRAPSAAPPPVASAPGRAWRVTGLVTGGVGGAVAVVGGVLGVLAAKRWSDSEAICSEAHSEGCADPARRQSAVELHDRAESLASGATVAAVLGGALIAGGVAIYVTAPSARGSAAVVPLPGGVGAIVRF